VPADDEGKRRGLPETDDAEEKDAGRSIAV